MKRIVSAGSGAFVLVILLIVLLASGKSRNAPSFVPGAPAVMITGGPTHYGWSANVPIQNNRIWIYSSSLTNTNRAIYLYDLKQRVILGQLMNTGWPVLQDRDGSRLLVAGPAPALRSAFYNTLISLGKAFHNKSLTSTRPEYSLWMLNTRDNSAKRVPGTDYPSSWQPSPDFRYGYTILPGTTAAPAVYICDFELNRVTRVDFPGWPRGWWDSHDIFVHLPGGNLGTFDLQTRQVRQLWTFNDINAFRARNGLADDPSALRAFANWNGREYDFYLGPDDKVDGLRGGDSFLVKIDRDGPSLKLMYRHFEFQWSGDLDASGTHYLYEGESGAPGQGGNGAVYLRDLSNGNVTMLVPPDNRGQYSRPRFFGDEVIYYWNSKFRRIKLDGTGDEPVLPEGGK